MSQFMIIHHDFHYMLIPKRKSKNIDMQLCNPRFGSVSYMSNMVFYGSVLLPP